MGEVIQFPGNSKKNPANHDNQPPTEELDQYRAERRGLMQSFSVEGGGPDDRAAIDAVAGKINALLSQNGISGETLQLRRDLVKDIDPLEASRILLASSEQDWLKSPTYFKALIERSRQA